MKAFYPAVVAAMSLVIASVSSPVLAENTGPDVITFKMGTTSMQFQHKKHLVNLKNDCFHCHKTTKGKIDGWGKDAAHTICIPCHDLDEKGPVECHQCHTK